VHLELSGYPVPPAQSQKAPPLEMYVVVSQDEANAVVARSEVPADQYA
jgi:hypothetical protein